MAYCNSKAKKRGKITSDLKYTNFPIALTIAGSDSGGGAGIQADLRTFSALRVYGTSAITALTAQNPLKVISIQPVKPDFLLDQLQAIFSAFHILSAKTGMLFNSKIIHTTASFISQLKNPPLLIIDPVMISSSGHLLLQKTAVFALKNKLFPLASFITPNIKEAELLTSIKIHDFDSAIKAAEKISSTWNCNCILKGGHSKFIGNTRTDIIILDKQKYLLSSPDIPCDQITTHGTGCTLSAALTANLAKNIPPLQAIILAKEFVYSSLLEKVQLTKNIKAMFPPTKKRLAHIKLKSI